MSFQTVVASREEARPAEPGSGHRTQHSAQTNPKHQTGVLRRPSSLWQDGTRLVGRRLVTSARPPPQFFLSALRSLRPRFRRRLRRMGWQQYSRIWGLSRDYPYILYRKQLTAGMRGWATGFPQGTWPFLLVPTGSGAGEVSAVGWNLALTPQGIRRRRGNPMAT